MTKLTIALQSLGCSKNLVDSEGMLYLLQEAGHSLSADPAAADVIIVNTCGFIEPAQQEAVDSILHLAEHKRTGRCRALIVVGCLPQRFEGEIIAQLPEVDGVLGTGSFHRICEAVQQALAKPGFEWYDDIDCPVLCAPDRCLSTPPYTAYIKIAEGCDNHCAFCIIPALKGGYRSRPIEDIVAEVARLCARGVREIILLAQDTAYYGDDLYGEYSLDRLLRALCPLEGLEWIRVHYLYPARLTEALLDTFEQEEKVLPYFDLPLQHCEDGVLSAMNRHATQAQVWDNCKTLRARFPKGALRTTLMVGFPGEDEAAFELLCRLVEELEFDRLGVFSFSPQEGTVGHRLSGQIADEIKDARRDKILAMQQGISKRRLESRIGDLMDVLCEARLEDGSYIGRSALDSIEVDGQVFFESSEALRPGQFVPVRITHCMDYDLCGVAEGVAR